jgi:hypothetical protein
MNWMPAGDRSPVFIRIASSIARRAMTAKCCRRWKASLNATANAWHRFAQELDLRGEPNRKKRGDKPTARSRSLAVC